MSDRVRLSAGNLRLELRPELGGAVSGFRIERPTGSFDLMRPLVVPAGVTPHALHSAMFPMVPFANCIRDNAFEFEGSFFSVSPNMPDVRLNYHGSGWQLPWQVTRQDGSWAELVLDDACVDQSFRYSARQSFELTPQALSVDLSVCNRGTVSMPFSCGLHPWFPRHDGVQIRFSAGSYWTEDDAGHAVELAAPSRDTDFSAWNTPSSTFQNKCFADWTGIAEVIWPAAGIRLSLKGDRLLGHLMYHVPQDGQPVFCLEPQTNAPCAFDGLERGVVNEGVHVLAPGEELGVSLRFDVQTGLGATPAGIG